MKVALLCIIIFIIIPVVSLAQDEPPQLHQGLGLSAAIVGGLGFSYRYMPERGPGFQGSIIGWDVGGDSYFHLALAPLLVLRNSGQAAMYLVAGWAMVNSEGDADHALGAGLGFAWRRFAWWPNEQFWTSFDLVVTSFRGDVVPYPQAAMHYLIW